MPLHSTHSRRFSVRVGTALRAVPTLRLLEGAWRVGYFDSHGAGYITIFTGQSASRGRATTTMRSSAALLILHCRAEVVTAKPVVSFPQKRRRRVR